jgi:hypothetical protein
VATHCPLTPASACLTIQYKPSRASMTCDTLGNSGCYNRPGGLLLLRAFASLGITWHATPSGLSPSIRYSHRHGRRHLSRRHHTFLGARPEHDRCAVLTCMFAVLVSRMYNGSAVSPRARNSQPRLCIDMAQQPPLRCTASSSACGGTNAHHRPLHSMHWLM